MYDMVANGKRLRELRGNKRLEEVAAACKISVTSLLLYEQGKRSPRDEIKISLAKYYKTTVQKLFYT